MQVTFVRNTVSGERVCFPGDPENALVAIHAERNIDPTPIRRDIYGWFGYAYMGDWKAEYHESTYRVRFNFAESMLTVEIKRPGRKPRFYTLDPHHWLVDKFFLNGKVYANCDGGNLEVERHYLQARYNPRIGEN